MRTSKDMVALAFVAAVVGTVETFEFVRSPRSAIRGWRHSWRRTMEHKPKGFTSKLTIYFDYLTFGTITNHTKVAIDTGAVNAIDLEPMAPEDRELYRDMHHV